MEKGDSITQKSMRSSLSELLYQERQILQRRKKQMDKAKKKVEYLGEREREREERGLIFP